MSTENCTRMNTYRARILADFALDPKPTCRRYIDRSKPQARKGWSLFVDVCERLTRDGVDFTVTLDPAVGEIRIVGTWTKARNSALKLCKVSIPRPPKDFALRAKTAERLMGAWGEKDLSDKIRNSPPDVRRVAGEMLDRTRHAADGDADLYRELLTAELEHWREMELAAETRDAFRPGLTEDRFAEDEGVRHAA